MMQELDGRYKDLARQNQELKGILTRLRSEADVLRELVLAHQGCACTKIQAYVRDSGGATLTALRTLSTASNGSGGVAASADLIADPFDDDM